MPMPVFVILGHICQHRVKGNRSIDILNQTCGPMSLVDALA